MNGFVVVAWILTAVFLALTGPCVLRLVRVDYVSLGQAMRNGDVAELLLVLAMVGMLSPIGGPIPAAGWEAVLLLAASWFLPAWWRNRRALGYATSHSRCGHHGLSAVAMLYMFAAVPHDGATHGPWLTMSTMDAGGGLAWPAVAVVAVAYFVADAARFGMLALRTSSGATASGFASRAACRSIMGLGMGYLLFAAL